MFHKAEDFLLFLSQPFPMRKQCATILAERINHMEEAHFRINLENVYNPEKTESESERDFCLLFLLRFEIDSTSLLPFDLRQPLKILLD